MVAYRETGAWQDAFEKVIPTRKRKAEDDVNV